MFFLFIGVCLAAPEWYSSPAPNCPCHGQPCDCSHYCGHNDICDCCEPELCTGGNYGVCCSFSQYVCGGVGGICCNKQADMNLFKIDGSHCDEFVAVDVSTACFKKFWAAHSYQFSSFSSGACPSRFNNVTSKDDLCTCTDFPAGCPVYTRALEIKPVPGPSKPMPSPSPVSPSPLAPNGTCASLGSICTGSKSSPRGSCCNGAFCKYWNSPAICQGCIACSCSDGTAFDTNSTSLCRSNVTGVNCSAKKDC